MGNFNDQQIQKLREKIQQNLQKELQRSLRESYSYSTSWSSTTSNGHNRQFGRQFEFTGQTHEHNLDHLETGNFKDFNQKQAQIAQQLEDELSKQLKNAVRTTYNSNSYSDLRPTDSQVLYQNLFNELQRNLTKQLQIVGTNRNSYSYSYTFNEQQLNRLRTKLERDLKLQLQQEVTSISTHHPENKLDQQQTDQELESSDLNQQIEDDAFRSHRKPGEQIVNTDRTQQQIGQEQVDADLILQNEDNLNQQVEATGFETPQFGDQEQIVQPSEQDQVNQIQQTDESNNVPKRLQIGNHQKGDNSQITQEQLDLNQQLDKNYYIPQQIPSANLQVNNRPVTPRPIDSNNFLKREREELLNTDQYVSGNSNVNYNQRPNGLPTLNQIIQQQQLGTNEHNTELLSPIEPLSVPENDDLNQQQVDIGQQSIEDLTGQTNTDLIQQNQINENTNNGKSLTLGQNNLPAGQISGQLNPLTSNQNSNRQVPLGQTGGESIGITSQGQLFRTQPQTLTDAEKEADLLIQRLRASQRNRGDQPSFGQSFTYVPYNQRVTPSPVVQHGGYGSDGSQTFSVQPVQEVNSFYQQHDSFGVYLNQEQAQFAKHLETELSKQVEDAVSQNYYTEAYSNSGSPNPQQYQTSYQQLSVDLQRNLTKQLQNILSSTQPGSSIYNSFTNQQREKLLNQLQADLLRQLQQSLKVSYGLEGQNIGYGSGYSGVHSSSLFGSTRHGSRGSNVYSSNIPNVDNYGLGQHTSQLQYGQPEETVQNVETVSDIQPIEPQQAHVVQNVEPQIGYSYNPGVKGHGRRYDSQLYGSPQHQSQLTADDFQQPLTSVPHAPPVDIQPPPVGSGTLQAEAVSSSQGDLASPTEGIVNQDDLPWWKRFGNKVKQGAHSLKEKIVG
ncbi:hypothetical protein NQ314_010016 [Rhamnusium bicolor]|uniref:Uncharacterized protein n=1 Tax=Rhamnusium bicolor TaxID=1586634 RepID=A0AAV8XU98_9CUCU|nr:hypothetical protein NQ314_010016 [Rhamnusium bicolor]